jgi:hypothetical protein
MKNIDASRFSRLYTEYGASELYAHTRSKRLKPEVRCRSNTHWLR